MAAEVQSIGPEALQEALQEAIAALRDAEAEYRRLRDDATAVPASEAIALCDTRDEQLDKQCEAVCAARWDVNNARRRLHEARRTADGERP